MIKQQFRQINLKNCDNEFEYTNMEFRNLSLKLGAMWAINWQYQCQKRGWWLCTETQDNEGILPTERAWLM